MSRKDAEKDFTKNGIFSFETKEKMPIKGLEKGDGGWGRGKEPFLVYYYLSLQLLPLARMGLPLVGAKGEEQLLDK